MFAPMHQPLAKFESQAEVARVMAETGMDQLQALRHVQGRRLLVQRMERGEIKSYPLGKSAELA